MTGLQSQRSINCLGGDYMKRLKVTMMCMAVYNSYIDVPDNLTILDKGIMPSEKVLDFPVNCNTLTGSVNL